MTESIRPFIHANMLVLNEKTPVKTAARAMYERKVGTTIVCDERGHISGIITDRDLSSHILGFDLSASTPLSKIANKEVFSVAESATIPEVIKIMDMRGIRRVPVVEFTKSGREKCVGMVSLDDLVASEKINSKQLGHIIRKQVIQPHYEPDHKRAKHRLDNTLNKFVGVVSKKLHVKTSEAKPITLFILKKIVQRLSLNGAAHFISQLPRKLHDDLLKGATGPDRTITAESIIEDMEAQFQYSRVQAHDTLRLFGLALEDLLGTGELRHVAAQIPADIRELILSEVGGKESKRKLKYGFEEDQRSLQ